jgi:dTDP-4-dehydrorhamnose reductase
MNNPSTLITGASGQLGRALKAKYPFALATTSKELNISDKDSVNNYDWSNIKLILNAAAYTNVDAAETNNGRLAAWRINASGAANLATVAREKNIKIVHVSTDYVFDGTRQSHYESEPFTPLGVYGQSKAAGDIVIANLTSYYILRTSWVIGEGNNFVRTMIELGKKGVSPTVVADQLGRLTFTSELVKAIDHLLTTDAKPGIYNVSNCGDVVSWADIARSIFADAGFDLKVTDTTTKEYFSSKTGIAERPLNSDLDLSKLTATGFISTNWRQDLNNYVGKELS